MNEPGHRSARDDEESDDQIRTAMNGHSCHCGNYPRILVAIQKAAAAMAKEGA
jgi:aerobic-type carbon monoxide dehydrogenase small subunit (CoxS/CutS family)